MAKRKRRYKKSGVPKCPTATRRVAPGTAFQTLPKISPPVAVPNGPGPTIAQLNEIQRLRDKTGVLSDKPRDRDQAERQIDALRMYLEEGMAA